MLKEISASAVHIKSIDLSDLDTFCTKDSDGEDPAAVPPKLRTDVPNQCMQGHLLVVKECTGKAWIAKRCNNCVKKLRKGEFRYSCKPCGFHLCEDCGVANKQLPNVIV